KLNSKNYPIILKENDVYFSDLSDHMFQLTDSLNSYRFILADLLTVYTSYVGLKTNRVMSFLTVLSTVFIPPTFIVGWYGMNFTNMPEFHWPKGQLLALGLVV